MRNGFKSSYLGSNLARALLPLLEIYIHRVVIPVEEARLREVFGDTL
jgi:hypothetical protein